MISANKLFCLLLKSPEKWRPFLPNVSMFINLTEIVRDPLWGSLLHKSDPWFGNWSEYYYTSTILLFMTRGLLMDGPISEIWLAILIFYLQSKITLAGRIDSSPHRSNSRNWTIGKKKNVINVFVIQGGTRQKTTQRNEDHAHLSSEEIQLSSQSGKERIWKKILIEIS